MISRCSSQSPSWCPCAFANGTDNSFGAEPKSKSTPVGIGQFFPTGDLVQAAFQSSPSVSRCDHLILPLSVSSATIDSTWSSGERQTLGVPPAKIQLT